MTTRIQLEGYGYIAIAEGTQFPLNFNIQDLTKPDTTPANYSKDIKIVGTPEVNRILSHAYDVNITDGSYDVNKRVKCSVIQNGANIFEDAYFQLIGVEINGGIINYKGRVKSDLMSFFTDIKAKELTDLNIYTPDDFQYLTKTNVKNTFNNNVNDRWKYAMGANISNSVFSVKDFKPAIYLKTYFDAIHEESGWEYEILHPEKIRFNELIVPNTNKFDSDEKKSEQNTFKQYQDFALGELNDSNGVNGIHQQRKFGKTFPIGNTPPAVNPNNSYNFLTKQYTPQVYGNYEIIIDTYYDVTYSFRDDAILRCTDTNSLFVKFYFEFTVRDSNGVDRWYQTQGFDIEHTEGHTFSAGDHLVRSGSGRFSTSLELYAGDKIIDWRVMTLEYTDVEEMEPGWNASWVMQTSTSTGVAYNPSIETKNWVMQVIPEVNYDWGVPVYLNEYIPKKIKQRDLIKSIVDAFKLITYVDPNQENKIIYELRDDYYDRGEEKDWTKKLALDKPINLEWLQDKQPKLKVFTYKEDKDAMNTVYQDNVKETYGQLNFNFENEYNVGEEKLELIFSPTPIVYNPYSNLYLPAIVSDAEDLNIRLLLDNGINPNGHYFIKESDNSVDWDVPENDYPSILHFDDAEKPSFDLNFYKSKYYFYNSWNDVTYNSLFQYHRRSLNQIADGRVMTAFFDLTELDILNLNLNDRIYLESTQSWWNINKVIDYNANGSQLTKVELVTIDDGQSISLSKRIGIGTVDEGINNRPVKPKPTNPIVNDGIIGIKKEFEKVRNTVIGNTSVVVGLDNWIENGSTGIIIGDGNKVSGKDSVVIGKNNSDEGYDNKLVIGNGAKAKPDYPATIQDVNIGNDINIGDIHFNENGITKNGSSITIDNNGNIVFNSQSGSTINGLDYLPLSGGTVTGPLTLDDIGTTTPIGNLGYDANGNVVQGISPTTVNSLNILDTRNDNEDPLWYLTNYGSKNVIEFKRKTSIGLDTLLPTGTFCNVETICQWLDGSGGYPIQIARDPNTGYVAKRWGIDDTTWSSWILDSGKLRIVPILYTDLKTLKDNNDLVTGTRYFISDRDIWIDALDTDKLSMSAKRHFRIVKDEYYTPHTLFNGIFTSNYLGIYGQTIAKGSVPISVQAGNRYYAIWGGRMWTRSISGADGGTVDNTTLGSGWELMLTTSNTYYESKIFDIKYDFDEDIIWEQSDDRANVIKRESFGVSFIDITDWGNRLLENNVCKGIFNNYKRPNLPAEIKQNNITGYIARNKTTNFIFRNSNKGNIEGNSVRGGVRYNSNKGNISFNTGLSNTDSYTKTADIDNNSNQGDIINNDCRGVINNNNNSGDINENVSVYTQSSSTFLDIMNNNNNGYINLNRSTNATIEIRNNNNNGNIGTTSITNRGSNVTDTIVNK